MEKLELKHLAPYLPFKLHVLTCTNIESNPVIEEMTISYLQDMLENPIGEKPILRPLSDFGNPCLSDGKVPIMELAKIGDRRSFPAWWDNSACVSDINGVNFWVIQKLLEWHFDVFGLIDAGLAVDINMV